MKRNVFILLCAMFVCMSAVAQEYPEILKPNRKWVFKRLFRDYDFDKLKYNEYYVYDTLYVAGTWEENGKMMYQMACNGSLELSENVLYEEDRALYTKDGLKLLDFKVSPGQKVLDRFHQRESMPRVRVYDVEEIEAKGKSYTKIRLEDYELQQREACWVEGIGCNKLSFLNMKVDRGYLDSSLWKVFDDGDLVFAEEDFTACSSDYHASVVAGEKTVESQLTEDEKAKVTHLTVTGTLQDVDYAFIRTSLLKQLRKLDLRDADIEIIPASALEYMESNGSMEYGTLKVVLPRNLKHLSARSFYTRHKELKFEVTGHFPTLGNEVFYLGDYGWLGMLGVQEPYANLFVVSEDNPYCVDLLCGGIYSEDMETLYFGSAAEKVFIEDCKVIAGHAFEGHWYDAEMTIPASVDSIGDCAFSKMMVDVVAGARTRALDYDISISNKSLVPQKLGKNVFDQDYYRIAIFVPAEAYQDYKNAEGWKDLLVYPDVPSGIMSIEKEAGNGGIYDLQGRVLNGEPQHGVYIRNGRKFVK